MEVPQVPDPQGSSQLCKEPARCVTANKRGNRGEELEELEVEESAAAHMLAAVGAELHPEVVQVAEVVKPCGGTSDKSGARGVAEAVISPPEEGEEATFVVALHNNNIDQIRVKVRVNHNPSSNSWGQSKR
mmetsp:Transcript_33595/g.69379  ORF Transcript_33595/g.69379 Transcript_33595/m.69379 type:complete len:131 (-) Transcript_33595:20-412(-)